MRKQSRNALAAFLVAGALLTMVVAATANARSSWSGSPSASAATVAAPSGVPIPGTMTATSQGYVTSLAFKVVKTKGWIGVVENIRVQKVPKSSCRRFKKFKNSNDVLGYHGKFRWYWDRNGYLCRDKFSPTGWVKRGGGHTGLDCRNIAAPPNVQMPMPHAKPPTKEVTSQNVTIRARVTANVTAFVKLWCGWASATGNAVDKIRIRAKTLIQTRGAKRVKLAMNIVMTAFDKAKNRVKVSCSFTPPPQQPPTPKPTPTPSPTPQPPHHFVNISCTGFEEVTGGRSFLVDCDVSNDNGAQITLDAHSNDGNSRVSGINCFSQGGTPSCHGNGTFEFRVTGINGSTNIVSSSITATASSNGVDKTFRSDPFPVDPDCTGFC
jgi:hypothetical protein